MKFASIYATESAAGADIKAYIREPMVLSPGTYAKLPTGIRAAIPGREGYEIQIRPRSGLAAKHGVTVLNGPGTIDADYEARSKCLLINHDEFIITPGMRIAQMVLAPIVQAHFVLSQELAETARGSELRPHRNPLSVFDSFFMVKISKYLDPRLILHMNVDSRDRALEKMVNQIYAAGKLQDKESFLKAIIDREKIIY